MQLKLASAIIARPRVLVLSEIFDVMPDWQLLESLNALQARGETTVICFSNKHSDLGFSHFLSLGENRQLLLDSYTALCDVAHLPRQALVPVPGGQDNLTRAS